MYTLYFFARSGEWEDGRMRELGVGLWSLAFRKLLITTKKGKRLKAKSLIANLLSPIVHVSVKTS